MHCRTWDNIIVHYIVQILCFVLTKPQLLPGLSISAWFIILSYWAMLSPEKKLTKCLWIFGHLVPALRKDHQYISILLGHTVAGLQQRFQSVSRWTYDYFLSFWTVYSRLTEDQRFEKTTSSGQNLEFAVNLRWFSFCFSRSSVFSIIISCKCLKERQL